MTCEKCGSTENVESVQVSGGRDYPPRPPEYADLCEDCRDELGGREGYEEEV